MTTKVIFKCDDLSDLSDNVLAFDKIVTEKKLKVSWGVIGHFLNNASKEYVEWVQKKHHDGNYEFWNHGYFHGHLHKNNPYEFLHRSVLQQYYSLAKTQKLAKRVFGFDFHCFGAPSNMTSHNTLLALYMLRKIKAWFYGFRNARQYIFERSVDIEFPAGHVDFEKCKHDYLKWGKPHDIIVYQLHPNTWQPGDFQEFEKIIDFLRQENIQFVLPRDIYNNKAYRKQKTTPKKEPTMPAQNLDKNISVWRRIRNFIRAHSHSGIIDNINEKQKAVIDYINLNIQNVNNAISGIKTICEDLKKQQNILIDNMKQQRQSVIDFVTLNAQNINDTIADIKNQMLELSTKTQEDIINSVVNSTKDIANTLNDIQTKIQNADSEQQKNKQDIINSVVNGTKDIANTLNDIQTKIQNAESEQQKNKQDVITTVETLNHDIQNTITNIKDSVINTSTLIQDISQHQESISKTENKIHESIQTLETHINQRHENVFDAIKRAENATSGITTTINKLSDKITNTHRDFAVLNSEPYWANVYHDTIINSNWLQNKSVSPGRWAVSYVVLYVLYRILDEIKPENILECGLGQSSKLTIQYADSHKANLMICENNSDWLSFFQRQFPTADKYTKILDTEMVHIVPEYESRTYAGFQKALGKNKFNLVLIDGPMGSEHYSRPEILDVVNNLDDSFVILLDDMNRAGERETWNLLKTKLQEKNIQFKETVYKSDKQLGLLCSPDLGWLATL